MSQGPRQRHSVMCIEPLWTSCSSNQPVCMLCAMPSNPNVASQVCWLALVVPACLTSIQLALMLGA
jgi:hypothetical protein